MFAVGDGRLLIDEIQQGYGTSRLPTLTKILAVEGSLLSVQVHPGDETVRRVAEGEMSVEQDLEANPTVRITDFGRRPGEYPQLGFELVRLEAGLRRVTPVEVSLPGGGELAVLVACPSFVKARLRLPAGGRAPLRPSYGAYRVLHCLDGRARIKSAGAGQSLARGETAFVPGRLESGLAVSTESGCTLFDDAVPDLDVLRGYLADAGASPGAIDALLNPPRATGE
jgi:hypothetical protein